MSQLSDLLEAVVATPDDDAPRRVYADALLEAGNPLGEFIHVQCDLAAGARSREEGVRLRLRERELLAAHEQAWRLGLYGLASEPRFVRGFIDEVTIGADAFADRGSELFRAAPALRAVMVSGLYEDAARQGGPANAKELVMGRFKRAIAAPALRRLRGFGHLLVGYGFRETQWDTYDTTSFGIEALELLLAADVSHLTSLALNAGTDSQLRLLAQWPVLKNLERLELQLRRAWSDADPSAVLAALDPAKLQLLALEEWSEGLARFPALRELKIVGGDKAVGALPPGLKKLGLRKSKLTTEVAAALAGATELEELELIVSDVPGWAALEQARFKRLRHAWIHCRELTMDHWRTLRRWPMAEHLELLLVAEGSAPDLSELRELFGCIVETQK